eukprot:CAMPEP_0113949714 /NCGR_PEP_ID=MMETSP1339-20121228/77199_1 /TAXON_ID=94617 /ORGANISM="Fibrocapsa japonica" /LENGTH=78 /DNA_ID=CAMNT_0000957275 /DNA_START=10 /DNA_END=243 /DNA_ORIENTATION=- /assembly_acc=CAM_ASM_000762
MWSPMLEVGIGTDITSIPPASSSARTTSSRPSFSPGTTGSCGFLLRLALTLVGAAHVHSCSFRNASCAPATLPTPSSN